MSIGIEAATWSEERIKDEINLRLEPGWVFRIGASDDQRMWAASIHDSEEEEIWADEALTSQLALLHALGWLENRKHKVAPNSPWVRRSGDFDPQRSHELAYSKSFESSTPAHLDPQEIENVIRSVRRHQG